MPYFSRAGRAVMSAYKKSMAKKNQASGGTKSKSQSIGPKEQTLFKIPGGQKRGGKSYIMGDPARKKSAGKARLKSIMH